MSEKCGSSGPGVGLLLLIPAAAIVAHAAKRHHRMMWEEIGGPGTGTPSPWHGHHRSFTGPGDAGDRFRLPPRIEWILDTWHTRAHAAAEPTEGSPAAPTEPASS